MHTFCHQEHFFLEVTYHIMMSLATFGVYSCSGVLFLSVAIGISFILFAKEWILYAEEHPRLFVVGCFVSAAYIFVAYLFFLTIYLLDKYRAFKRRMTRRKALEIANLVCSYWIFPLEFLFYELKCISLAIFMTSESLKDDIEREFSKNLLIGIYFLLWADWAATLALSLFKCRFLRQEIPDGSFFSRLPCSFETVYLLTTPLTIVCSIYMNRHSPVFKTEGESSKAQGRFLQGQNSLNYSYFSALLSLTVINWLFYITELPYYHRFCERFLSHMLALVVVVSVSIGLSNYDYNSVCKIVCLMIPFQIVFIEIYLEYVYNDKFEFSEEGRGRGLTVAKIKMILTGSLNRHTSEALKNKFFKYTASKSSRSNAYNQRQETQIMNALMLEKEDKLLKLLKEQRIDTKELDLSGGESAIGGNFTGSMISNYPEKDTGTADYQTTYHRDVIDDISYLIINQYLKEGKQSQHRCFVKIDWMLRRKLILSEILTLLNTILLHQESLRNKFLCYCALKRVENKFHFFYKMKERSENGYKDLNNVGFDLETVMVYKERMIELTNLTEEFSNLNYNTFQSILSDNANLRSIYRKKTRLFHLNQHLTLRFKILHENTLKTECYHLIPYFYHLLYNLNLYRSSKKIYTIFTTRWQAVKKAYLDTTNIKLDNLSVLYRSTTFVCDSNQSSLSRICNVYGNRSHKYQSCLGKYPDVILPRVQNRFHHQAMSKYLHSDNTNNLKNINHGFTRQPNDKMITKTVIIIKVTPNLKKEFNFMVNLMDNQNPEDFYILVNQDAKIDSFSKNFTKLVSKRFLKVDTKIGTLSPRSQEFITRVVRNNQFFRGMTPGSSGERDRTKPQETVSMSDDQHFPMSSKVSLMRSNSRKNRSFKEMFTEEFYFGGNFNRQGPFVFNIKISFCSFKYIAGGYFLLRLREKTALHHDEVKKRARKYLNQAGPDFVLNFGNSTKNKEEGQHDKSFSSSDDEESEGQKSRLMSYNATRGGTNIHKEYDPNNVFGNDGFKHPITRIKTADQNSGQPEEFSVSKQTMDFQKKAQKYQSAREIKGQGKAFNFEVFKPDETQELNSKTPSKPPNKNFKQKCTRVILSTEKSGESAFKTKVETKRGNRNSLMVQGKSTLENNYNTEEEGGSYSQQGSRRNSIQNPQNDRGAGRASRKSIFATKLHQDLMNVDNDDDDEDSSRSQMSSSRSSSINSKDVLNSQDCGGHKKNKRRSIEAKDDAMGRSSIYTINHEMGHKHNKLIYEDACTRKNTSKELKMNMGLCLFSVVIIVGYMITIFFTQLLFNQKIDKFTDFTWRFFEYDYKLVQITNKVLMRTALDKDKISNSRYEEFGLRDHQDLRSNLVAEGKRLVEEFNQEYLSFLEIMAGTDKILLEEFFKVFIDLPQSFLSQAEVIGRQDAQGRPLVLTRKFDVFGGFLMETFKRIQTLEFNHTMKDFIPFYLEEKEKLIENGYGYSPDNYLLYLTPNVLTTIYVLRFFIDESKNLIERYIWAMKILIIIASISFGLIFMGQVILFRRLTKNLGKVFNVFHQISKPVAQKRTNQLEMVGLIIKSFKRYNYTVHDIHFKHNIHRIHAKSSKSKTLNDSRSRTYSENIKSAGSSFFSIENRTDTSSGATGNPGKLFHNRNKKRYKYSSNTFMFHLLPSIITAFTRVVMSVVFFLLTFLFILNTIKYKQDIYNKGTDLNMIFLKTITLYNGYLEQYIFRDPRVLLFKLPIREGLMTQFNLTMKSWNKSQKELFEVYDMHKTYKRLIKFTTENPCSFVPSLRDTLYKFKDSQLEAPICDFGSVGYLRNPLSIGVTSNYMNLRNLNYNNVGNISEAQQRVFFNLPRIIEWEFSFFNIQEALRKEFIKDVKEINTAIYEQGIKNSKIQLVPFSIIFSGLFLYLAVKGSKNGIDQMAVVSFAFQIFSIKAVLENDRIKTTFMRFFKMNKRDFI